MVRILEDREAWASHAARIDGFGEKLRQGQVGLILGAGASIGFGLPGWKELIRRMNLDIKGAKLGDEFDPVGVSQDLLEWLGEDQMEFSRKVSLALYDGFNPSLLNMQSAPLLASIGAVLFRLSKTSRPSVISYNFDDLLQTYLSYFGLKFQSVHSQPAMSEAADAVVYQVHGMLPHRSPGSVASPVVMSRTQLADMDKKYDTVWGNTLRHVLLSHSCIFIGLSGDDPNFRGFYRSIRQDHPCGEAYWGLRFGLAPEVLETDGERVKDAVRVREWMEWGVYTVPVKAYSDVPEFLYSIIQASMG